MYLGCQFEFSVGLQASWFIQLVLVQGFTHLFNQVLYILDLSVFLAQGKFFISKWMFDLLCKLLHGLFVLRIVFNSALTNQFVCLQDLSLVYLSKYWILSQTLYLQSLHFLSFDQFRHDFQHFADNFSAHWYLRGHYSVHHGVLVRRALQRPHLSDCDLPIDSSVWVGSRGPMLLLVKQVQVLLSLTLLETFELLHEGVSPLLDCLVTLKLLEWLILVLAVTHTVLH